MNQSVSQKNEETKPAKPSKKTKQPAKARTNKQNKPTKPTKPTKPSKPTKPTKQRGKSNKALSSEDENSEEQPAPDRQLSEVDLEENIGGSDALSMALSSEDKTSKEQPAPDRHQSEVDLEENIGGSDALSMALSSEDKNSKEQPAPDRHQSEVDLEENIGGSNALSMDNKDDGDSVPRNTPPGEAMVDRYIRIRQARNQVKSCQMRTAAQHVSYPKPSYSHHQSFGDRHKGFEDDSFNHDIQPNHDPRTESAYSYPYGRQHQMSRGNLRQDVYKRPPATAHYESYPKPSYSHHRSFHGLFNEGYEDDSFNRDIQPNHDPRTESAYSYPYGRQHQMSRGNPRPDVFKRPPATAHYESYPKPSHSHHQPFHGPPNEGYEDDPFNRDIQPIYDPRTESAYSYPYGRQHQMSHGNLRPDVYKRPPATAHYESYPKPSYSHHRSFHGLFNDGYEDDSFNRDIQPNHDPRTESAYSYPYGRQHQMSRGNLRPDVYKRPPATATYTPKETDSLATTPRSCSPVGTSSEAQSTTPRPKKAAKVEPESGDPDTTPPRRPKSLKTPEDAEQFYMEVKTLMDKGVSRSRALAQLGRDRKALILASPIVTLKVTRPDRYQQVLKDYVIAKTRSLKVLGDQCQKHIFGNLVVDYISRGQLIDM